MAVHIIDAMLTKDRHGSQEMREIFDEYATIQKWLDVEAAAARAQAKLGIIPEEVAKEITLKAKLENLDLKKYKERYDRILNPGVPFIQTFQDACSKEARQYVHIGLATQNLEDTALILQIKDAIKVIKDKLCTIEAQLSKIAAEHKDTIMVGRTHGQHGLPITFGFKVAVWITEIRHHLLRLEEVSGRVLVGLAGGPMGTLAFNGEIGLKVAKLIMDDLGLGTPEIPARSIGDHITEFTCLIGMIGMTLHKIAKEIYCLQRPEIDEVQEPFRKGRVGSSSMPHKRNPTMCMCIMRNGRFIASNVPLALEYMSQEHEGEGTYSEFLAKIIPETCSMLGGSLNLMINVLSDLVVKPENMRRNLDLLHGMLASEMIMKLITDKVGRETGHTKIHEWAMIAYNKNIPFRDVVKSDPDMKKWCTEQELNEAFDYKNGVGLSSEFVDMVLNSKDNSTRKEA